MLDHCKRVARELVDEPESYAPVMEVDRTDGDLLWGPWINGFERAMRLRADAWDAIAFGDLPAHGRKAGSDEACPCGSGGAHTGDAAVRTETAGGDGEGLPGEKDMERA